MGVEGVSPRATLPSPLNPCLSDVGSGAAEFSGLASRVGKFSWRIRCLPALSPLAYVGLAAGPLASGFLLFHRVLASKCLACL